MAEGESCLFSIGEKVVYKTNAVCNVEAVEVPVFADDKSKKYYKLRYLFSNGNEVVYVPVDSKVNIRACLSQDEAQKCFDKLKNVVIEEFEPRQPALIAAHFQQILSDCSIDSSLRVMKEILVREKRYSDAGKKLRQTETHYLGIVEKAVCEELSIVLGKELEEIKAMIRQAIFED